jgi:hypothetical protein
MFPNVRLMIVAVLASIAGISCGLGLFATFRVNHDPLARLSNGNPTLQLAFNSVAEAPDNSAAPFVVRFPVSAAVAAPVPVMAPLSADNDAKQDILPDKQDVLQDNGEAARKDGAGDVALRSPPPQSPPAASGADDEKAAHERETSGVARSRTAHKAVPVHRVVKLRRPRPAKATAQPAGQYTQPAYQWSPQAATPRAVQRRVLVKRRSTTDKSAGDGTAEPTVVGGFDSALSSH